MKRVLVVDDEAERRKVYVPKPFDLKYVEHMAALDTQASRPVESESA